MDNITNGTKKDLLLELEEPFRRITCGLNAMYLMTSGMEYEQDPYADGIFALWSYLREAEEAVSKILSSVAAGQ